MTRFPRAHAVNIPKRAALASLLTLAAMALAHPLARAEEPGAVAILQMQLPAEWQGQQRQLEKKVKMALRESGFEVQARPETQKRLAGRSDLLGCATEACMPEAGKLAKVDHLLRATLVTTKDVYSVNAEMFDAVDGKSLATMQTSCHKNDPCPPVADGWSLALRTLGEKAKATLAGKSDAPVVAPAPVVAAGPEPAKEVAPMVETLPVAAVERDEARDEGAWKRPVLVGAMIAGAALVGVGAYWWGIDGNVKSRTKPTPEGNFDEIRYATKTQGIIALASGALVLGGSALLWWQTPAENQEGQSAPRVSLHVLPGGFSVAGSF